MKSREWISYSEAARRMDTSPSAVNRMIRCKLLTTRCFPGGRPQVRAKEVERLAESAVRGSQTASGETLGPLRKATGELGKER
jgi:hypothetical protein